MQKCACTSTTSATAYPKSPVQHHCTTNDCPGPSPEASEYPPALPQRVRFKPAVIPQILLMSSNL